jgi:hypothetical protein
MAVENHKIAFPLDFSIFPEKTNFNTLFIEYKITEYKDFSKDINSLLTPVEKSVKISLICTYNIITKNFLLSKDIFVLVSFSSWGVVFFGEKILSVFR